MRRIQHVNMFFLRVKTMGRSMHPTKRTHGKGMETCSQKVQFLFFQSVVLFAGKKTRKKSKTVKFNSRIKPVPRLWSCFQGKNPRHCLREDLITHNAAISACEKAGEWQQALVLFEEIFHRKAQPNEISFLG